mmetsp:Transcript_46094/g.121717  ORF Transcript_46094/g.121717 Transcript_46094/m.121717 type:complete len:221 (+) Transcript_46094:780-1442(+)
MRIQRTQVRVRGALVVHAHQDALEKARDSRASFAMPEVRFRCRDDHGLLACVNSHHLSVGTNLDGITQRSSCAVALGGVNLRRLYASLLNHCIGAPLLCGPVRRSQGGTPAILVGLAASQQTEIPSLTIEILQLNANGCRGLSTCVSVSREVVCEAAAQVRVHASGTTTNVGPWAQAEIHTANNYRLTGVKVLVHQVQLPCVSRHKGRGTGSVDGHARPL